MHAGGEFPSARARYRHRPGAQCGQEHSGIIQGTFREWGGFGSGREQLYHGDDLNSLYDNVTYINMVITPKTITSFYGSSSATHGKDALNTPETLPGHNTYVYAHNPLGCDPCCYWHRRTRSKVKLININLYSGPAWIGLDQPGSD
eukprot:448056-Prorocentrum_minimum.AAC.1